MATTAAELKVLVATDGSESAAETAAAAARLVGGQAVRFIVVSVTTMPELTLVAQPGLAVAPRNGALDEGLRQDAERAAAAAAKRVAKQLGDRVRSVALTGDPGSEICRLAEEAGADVVVVGARGLGPIRRAILGSVSDYVVRHAPCPVLVVRHRDDEEDEAQD
jgi:nucleotide-binding universal stress UspA family protein